ncbi:vacuolar protein-sorting-associated protein 36-like [Uranotaenia lowii]|uniref:vacuolar protein-sorting-associated protein 36-like n=1 Tax=Uranotaenia lowii TaxID=190385 RepID=UPI00247900AD|nr:vacuolar protein-sorting-associated protein 36-like [Uranotaenia lowii]
MKTSLQKVFLLVLASAILAVMAEPDGKDRRWIPEQGTQLPGYNNRVIQQQVHDTQNEYVQMGRLQPPPPQDTNLLYYYGDQAEVPHQKARAYPQQKQVRYYFNNNQDQSEWQPKPYQIQQLPAHNVYNNYQQHHQQQPQQQYQYVHQQAPVQLMEVRYVPVPSNEIYPEVQQKKILIQSHQETPRYQSENHQQGYPVKIYSQVTHPVSPVRNQQQHYPSYKQNVRYMKPVHHA